MNDTLKTNTPTNLPTNMPKYRFRDVVQFVNENDDTYTGSILSSKWNKELVNYVYIVTYYELYDEEPETNTFSTIHEKVVENRIIRKM